MSVISIKKGPIQLVGLLYKPISSSSSTLTKSLGLVIVHPGGGIKEQTASLYAKFLAEEHGFTTICYDASNQGESGGEPHFLEDPSQRVSDVFAVVDYLQLLDTYGEHRGTRRAWDGDGDEDDPVKHVETLKIAAQQISAEVQKGVEAAVAPYVPPRLDDDKTPYDLKEAHDYYLTPRAQHPRAANKMLVRSFPHVLNFDAFHLADLYLKQPVLLIAGEKAGSRWHTEKLDKLIGGAKKKVIVTGGTHMDFYDKPAFVGPAVKEVAGFMNVNMHMA